jgi:hypothetical protein
MDDEITAYIIANRGTYTDQAIRETLIAVGHDPGAIDEAFDALGLVAPPSTDGAAAGRPSGLLEMAWIAFVIGGLAGLAGLALAGSASSGGSLPLSLGAYVSIYVGIGLLIMFLLRWAVPRFGLRGISAVLLGVALVPVFGALMLGTCGAAFAIGSGS